MIIYDPIYQFENKRDNNFSLQLSLAFQHHGLKKKISAWKFSIIRVSLARTSSHTTDDSQRFTEIDA